MTQWEYLEAQHHIAHENDSIKCFVLPVYCTKYDMDSSKTYSLPELGEERWNLTMMISDLDTNISRLVFRRPK